jgi:hypothetical protein
MSWNPNHIYLMNEGSGNIIHDSAGNWDLSALDGLNIVWGRDVFRSASERWFLKSPASWNSASVSAGIGCNVIDPNADVWCWTGLAEYNGPMTFQDNSEGAFLKISDTAYWSTREDYLMNANIQPLLANNEIPYGNPFFITLLNDGINLSVLIEGIAIHTDRTAIKFAGTLLQMMQFNSIHKCHFDFGGAWLQLGSVPSIAEIQAFIATQEPSPSSFYVGLSGDVNTRMTLYPTEEYGGDHSFITLDNDVAGKKYVGAERIDSCRGSSGHLIPPGISKLYFSCILNLPLNYDPYPDNSPSNELGILRIYRGFPVRSFSTADINGVKIMARISATCDYNTNVVTLDKFGYRESGASPETLIPSAGIIITKGVDNEIIGLADFAGGLFKVWYDGNLIVDESGILWADTPIFANCGAEHSAHVLAPGNIEFYRDIIFAENMTPSDPSNLIGFVISKNEIDLSWTDNAGDEIGFKIERALGGGSFLQVGSVLSDVTNYNDIGLLPDTTYRYRVCAYNLDGDSGYTNIVTAKTLPNVQPSSFGGGPGGGFGRITQIQRPFRRLF